MVSGPVACCQMPARGHAGFSWHGKGRPLTCFPSLGNREQTHWKPPAGDTCVPGQGSLGQSQVKVCFSEKLFTGPLGRGEPGTGADGVQTNLTRWDSQHPCDCWYPRSRARKISAQAVALTLDIRPPGIFTNVPSPLLSRVVARICGRNSLFPHTCL